MNKLREIPEYDRPCEKLVRCGASVLTDQELLAVILRTGTSGADVMELSARILSVRGEGLSGLLYRSLEEFEEIGGVGRVKACQLLASAELAKRIWRRDSFVRGSAFTTPSSLADFYMQEMRFLEQEQLRAVYLDTRLRFMHDEILTIGTVNSSVVSVREVMISALKHRAVNLILLHNHPSGDPSPSREDEAVTRQVAEAGKLIGIHLADHVIIGDNTYCSFKEWGLL